MVCFSVLFLQPSFWTKLSSATKRYFSSQKQTFEDISSWEKWRWHLNAADRLRFFVHSLEIMGPLVPASLTSHWELWISHVWLVRLCAQHSITREELDRVGNLTDDVLLETVSLYGKDELTINSHWLFHAKTFIVWSVSLPPCLHHLWIAC